MASFRIDEQTDRRLGHAAWNCGLSKSEFIRMALQEKINAVLGAEVDWDKAWAAVDAISLPEPVPFGELDERAQYLYRKHIGEPPAHEQRALRVADAD